MMFMDPSKYQQHSATASSHFYGDDNFIESDNKYSQFQQYDLETADISRHVCPVCDKTFRASSLLDIHMRVHVGAKPFVCPVCNHRATQKGNLKLHMKKHHGQDLPSHIDLVPDSGIWGSFSNNENIGEAELSLFLNTKKKTALAHSSLLNEDVVELIKKCQNNIGQSTMGRITESLTDFLDIAKQRLQCESYPSKHGLPKEELPHENINSNNNGMTNFDVKLEESPARIASNDATKSTMKNNLQEQPPNVSQKQYCFCKICGWKTTSSGYLNVHMRKHKAESHVCTICGRAFKETWYLKNHMRSHVNDIVYEPERSPTQSSPVFETTPSLPKAYAQNVDEKDLHENNNEKAVCSMCVKCGLVFSNQSISAHGDLCGKGKSRVRDCEVCESPASKVTFMGSLGLVEEGQTNNDKKVPKNLKSFNALIGNLVVCSSEKSSECVPEKPSDNPLYSLKQEIMNSIAQNGMEATKKSFRELIKNPNFKVLLTSDHLQSIAEIFNVEGDEVKSRNLLLNRTASSRTKSNRCSEVRPYENSAIQSLAIIGKSLKVAESPPHESSVTVQNVTTDQHPQGFQCDYCPKWFKYRSVLGIHMRSHTGERPYKCVYCGYAGTQHNCLKLHVQRHHPEVFMKQNDNGFVKEKVVEMRPDVEQEHMLLSQAAKFSPARCPICDRVSPSPGYLKIHMRSHKKTLDHVCHICGRGFKEYWYLSTHLRTHDGEINMPASEEPQRQRFVQDPSFATHPPSATHHNSVLTKQKSVPLPKQDISHMGHSYLTGTSSWSPLNVHEDNRTSPSANANTETVKLQSTRQGVSKRKAFLPSRHRTEPYPSQEPVRSRKSKPRKLSHGLYLAPVFQTLEANNRETTTPSRKSADCDQPLDLSFAVTTPPGGIGWGSNEEEYDEEPLNLVAK